VQKRALTARRQIVGLLCVFLLAYPLALRAVSHLVTGEHGLQSGGGAKVSFERIGTKVTSAVERHLWTGWANQQEPKPA